MKMAALLIDEIFPDGDVKHFYGYWDEEKKEEVIAHRHALYYGHAVKLLRSILEIIAENKKYTRRWKDADILVLLTAICSCCDGGENMINTIKFVRDHGYCGQIIAIVNILEGDEALESMKEDSNLLFIKKNEAIKEITKIAQTAT